jgi:hypothetical protein
MPDEQRKRERRGDEYFQLDDRSHYTRQRMVTHLNRRSQRKYHRTEN